MSNIKNNQKFISDLSGKFLFMRHGQSIFNKVEDESRKINPGLCDAHLSEEGINQVISKQKSIKHLLLEKIYVSPYYRAIQTAILALQKYDNKNNITVFVHPKLGEKVCSIHDFMIDIKQTKKDFNLNSKIKVDWSLFDNYVNESNYDENFFFFDNIDLLNNKEKEEEYLKLKNLYDKGDMVEYKSELGKFLKEKYNNGFESYKHVYERFNEFVKFLKNKFNDTINDKNKKILCVTHSALINIGTSSKPIINNEKPDNIYKIKNAEIISLII